MSCRQFTRFRRATLVYCCLAIGFRLSAQVNPNFNVNLIFDYSAAERALDLYEDQLFNTRELADLRGSRVAASTTRLISGRTAPSDFLLSYLDSLRYHQPIQDDVFQLERARADSSAIRKLLLEMQRRNFSGRIAATVEQLFPPHSSVNVTIPVYVVAFGHENVDAYVRRVVWKGNAPLFVGESEGELTIVINLAHAADYAPTVDDQLISILTIVAHEVFHSAFGAYKDASPTWKRYYRSYHRPLDNLVDLTQNEGIAYYLSLEQQGRGYLPHDWDAHTREAFSTFNKRAVELLSPSTSASRISELLRSANLSGYWESYGSITGMFIAREIDQKLGRVALTETVAAGPWDFLGKYRKLMAQDSNLPRLGKAVLDEIP